jgi:hypothetical protein
MHNNSLGGQAMSLRSNTTVSAQVSHQTSVSVTGFRV